MSHASSEFIPAHIAIMTVSDSRGAAEDPSGQYLQEAAQEDGHQVVDRAIVKDDIYQFLPHSCSWQQRQTSFHHRPIGPAGPIRRAPA